MAGKARQCWSLFFYFDGAKKGGLYNIRFIAIQTV